MPQNKVAQEFGTLVFSDAVMQERLPKPTYKKLSEVIKAGHALDLDIANEVAHAMKEWALEKGATHYTHWFQPLTGLTSEKHDSFLTPKGNGTVLMTFSGTELIQSETDASSFPSGGMRATFEARGYTAWDPTSPAFIKDEVLCIPTAFISYTGEALDKKTPLLRSMVALETQAKRALAILDKHPKRITTTIGPEQEYFLIKEDDFALRPDLILCGRTLFGCAPSKGQELEEHYFGAIRPTVNEFMKELDDELWKLGIPAKTKHNEVAPCQHELAPIYEHGSVAIDNNLLTMEKMKLIASRHGLVCLEHERPFEYVNGSGKHDNWSLVADGENLLNPTNTPEKNLVFLLFLTCVIAAVDTHQDLLRASVATAGNDHRLGANEAPPAIVSIYVGEDLQAVIDALMASTEYTSHEKTVMDLGVPQLADVLQDNTDRNRTSPFAFTGNKFEFRMCGSQLNLCDPNTVLNTAVAQQLDRFATDLSSVEPEKAQEQVYAWIKQTLTKHKRILFNGNGYSREWEAEAKARGLSNFKTTPEALPAWLAQKSIDLFEAYHVLSKKELNARFIAQAEQYSKLLHIEANVMSYMTRHMYLPALINYSGTIANGLFHKKQINLVSRAEENLLRDLNAGIDAISEAVETLETRNQKAHEVTDALEQDLAYLNQVIPAMHELRTHVDAMEALCCLTDWPVPSYNKMLFYV